MGVRSRKAISDLLYDHIRQRLLPTRGMMDMQELHSIGRHTVENTVRIAKQGDGADTGTAKHPLSTFGSSRNAADNGMHSLFDGYCKLRIICQ